MYLQQGRQVRIARCGALQRRYFVLFQHGQGNARQQKGTRLRENKELAGKTAKYLISKVLRRKKAVGEMKLCRPCAEELKRQGKKLTGKALGVDAKITCDKCGRRRYGQAYEEKKL